MPAQKTIDASYGRTGAVGMACSGAGAAMAAVFSNPLDVAKVRMMMQGEGAAAGAVAKSYTGPIDCIAKTFRAEGIVGVQRGLTMSMIREGCKCFFRIGLYQPIMDNIHDPSEGPAPMYKRFFAGASSGMTGALICNPLDLLKTRLQVQGSAFRTGAEHGSVQYNGIRDAVRKMYATEGVKGFWKGTTVSMLRSGCVTSCHLAFNSKIKEELARYMSPGSLHNGVSSGCAAFIAVMVMNPLDVVRCRLYNQPVDANGQGMLYKGAGGGLFECFGTIARTEGVLAFWKGAWAHFLRFGPHAAGTFIFIGYLQDFARNAKQRQLDAQLGR